MNINKLKQFKEISEDMTVLIVDDEVNLTRYFGEIAKRFFKKVDIVNSGEEAVNCFEEGKYDLIYTDINMPGMNGIELIRAIKDVCEKQKFIVISASDDASKLMELLHLHISDFIIKPFSVNNFVNVSLTQLCLLLQSRLIEKNTHELQTQLSQVIEEKKEQENMLTQQSKLAQTGEMISMIAHQWRQPLASISAIAGTLSIDIELDEYKKEFFEENLNAISDLSLHLSSTINDFRGFFNEEKEKISVNWKDLVESSLQIIEPSMSSSNVMIDKDFTDTSSVLSYQNEVRQVVLNIIKNAEDALIENKISQPHIWIKSYAEEGYICLSIEDNAGGVPEGIVQKVFTPYFSTKVKKDGTGLGLYMSKMIMETHCGGYLKLENSDRGAVFILQLPQSTKDEIL